LKCWISIAWNDDRRALNQTPERDAEKLTSAP
jgi:hypothetical protein